MTEGFTKVEDVALVPIEELAAIEGFDDGVAEELQSRAKTYLEEQEARFTAKRKELGVTDEVAAVPGMNSAMLAKLGEGGVKTLDDLGDLATDELLEMLKGLPFTEEQANAAIMEARKHWFDENGAVKS